MAVARTRFGRREIRLLYILLCLGMILGLGSIRSAPIYGKLDFILLDGRPWWPAWRPLIETVLKESPDKKVLTDPLTSTVLRAVFHQDTVHFRALARFHLMDVETMDRENRIRDRFLPLKVIAAMLLQQKSVEVRQPVGQMAAMVPPVRVPGRAVDLQPYLCLINMHGFTPSWVARETHHWQSDLADTGLYYHYQGLRGQALRDYLHDHPPENCLVVY